MYAPNKQTVFAFCSLIINEISIFAFWHQYVSTEKQTKKTHSFLLINFSIQESRGIQSSMVYGKVG